MHPFCTLSPFFSSGFSPPFPPSSLVSAVPGPVFLFQNTNRCNTVQHTKASAHKSIGTQPLAPPAVPTCAGGMVVGAHMADKGGVVVRQLPIVIAKHLVAKMVARLYLKKEECRRWEG